MQYQPQYQQEYAPQAAQQHFEALPAGYGAPATNGYQQAAQYGGAPMQQGYAPEQQMPYDPQMQYVQQAQYADPGQFQQQAFAGGQPMMQPMHMAQPPMQHTQYVAAPQPAFQQPLGNGGKGKLVKAGRYWPGKWCKLFELEKPIYEIDLLRNQQQRGHAAQIAPPPPNKYFEEGSSGEAL